MASEGGLGARHGVAAPGRRSGCSGHLGARTPREGRTEADGQAVVCQAAEAPAQVGGQRPGDWADMRAILAMAVGRAMRGAFRGVRWIWVLGRKKGETDGRAPVGASHQSRVMERAKAWPREHSESCARQSQPGSRATGSPGGPSGTKRRLGWTWRCSRAAGQPGRRVVSPLVQSPGGRAEGCGV